jgi:carboxymethylenebutenolidase
MTEGVRAERIAVAEGLEGYLARPDDGATYPGVILIQEASGIDENIRQTTERLAAEGYTVLAPDLYHGRTASTMEESIALLRSLDQKLALNELHWSVDYLVNLDGVAGSRVGIVGFCMGGRYTWWTAMQEGDRIAVIAPFYAGRFQPTREELERVTAPILIIWGSEDQSTPPEDREHIVTTLTSLGKTFEVRVYPAGHAFMNPYNTRGYSEESANQAWSELMAWFVRYLR